MTEADIIVALQTGSPKYAYASRSMIPAGIVIHSTGCNNPNLKRYVNCPDKVGANPNNNYFGGPGSNSVLPHAVIGRDIKGIVRIAQILPWEKPCQGCGTGSKGSYNTNPAYVQVEICEDDLADVNYMIDCMRLASEWCRYMMDLYPSITIGNIVSHAEAHKRGYATNHGDPDHWLKKHGRSMDWFRGLIPAPKADNKLYRVQVGAYGQKSNAEKMAAELKAKGYDTIIKEDTI